MSAILPVNSEIRSAEGLSTLIRRRYPPGEYAVLFEVRDATGFAACRSADAIAFSLWPSRGLEVSGFEIKVSRADWIKELRDPAKAESIARYCDRWWLVAGNEKIVAPGELPPTWGLMVPRGNALHVVTPAAKLDAIPLDRAFVAAVCRAAQSASPSTSQIAAAVESARKDWDTQRKRVVSDDQRRAQTALERLQGAVKAFEEASGVHMPTYDAGKIGHAVHAVLNGNLRVARDIEIARAQLKSVVDQLDDLLTIEAIKRPIEDVA